MILIDSVYVKHKKYYPQVLLENYKHVVRENIFITDKTYSDDSDEIQMKAIKCINLFFKETRIT